MTTDGTFKQVVRRHAQDTGQRYTEALSDLDGVEARLFPRAHRRAPPRPSAGAYGIDVSEQGPVAIQWKAAGRGPRLADFAYLMWGTWLDEGWIDAAVGAYRRHVALTDDELDRLEAVMYLRPLYLLCFDYRRSVATGHQPDGSEGWWNGIDAGYISAAAHAARTAIRR